MDRRSPGFGDHDGTKAFEMFIPVLSIVFIRPSERFEFIRHGWYWISDPHILFCLVGQIHILFSA